MSIYKLENEDGLIYIGSTKNEIRRRLSNHKTIFKNKSRSISSSKLFENNKKVTITLLEEVEDLDNLTLRERHYIENTECVNLCIPNRTAKEWRNDNIDYIKKKQNEYSKNYYLENKERILKRMKDKYNNNKCL
tara:strand:- start:348 stop:749 length:402 start_codon:yes stop_codon:yes gene_type:complete